MFVDRVGVMLPDGTMLWQDGQHCGIGVALSWKARRQYMGGQRIDTASINVRFHIGYDRSDSPSRRAEDIKGSADCVEGL